MTLTITILIDDVCSKPDLRSEHGFAAWVQTPTASILFDTGQHGTPLRHNLRQLGLDPGNLSALALSHGHYDHTGGLPALLQTRPDLPLFMHPDARRPRFGLRENTPPKPIGMPEESLRLLQGKEDHIRWVTGPTRLAEGIWLTGPVPRRRAFESAGARFFFDAAGREPDALPDDQALWIDTDEGPVVLLGCAHAGLLNTLDAVRELSGSSALRAVVGGMHLLEADTARLAATVDALHAFNIPLIAPCHCTGRAATRYLVQHLGERCAPCETGDRIEF